MERKMSSLACSVFNELRLEGKLCDAVIRVKDREFNAHKNILCSCSPYFRALFTGSWSDAGRRKFTIPGVEPEAMELIIEYAYMRTLPVTCANVERLLVAADQFNVMGIVRLCCAFLREHISFDSCVEVYRFSGFYALHDLQQSAFAFMLQNFEALAGSREQFCELTADELELMLSQDELTVRSEHTAYDAILTWLSGDVEARTRDVPRLLAKLRLSLMRLDVFLGHLDQFERIRDRVDCREAICGTVQALLAADGPALRRPRLPSSVLFAVGGWSASSPTNAVEAFDARSDSWRNVTPEHEFSPRAYHGTAFLRPHVYVVGGFDSADYFNGVLRLEPASGAWRQVAPMHERRCYVSVAVLGGALYAMGGFDGYARLSSAERYEPESNQWSMIATMNAMRSDASATALGGRVYICGGFNGNECLFTAEHYCPETNAWTLFSPMTVRRSGIGVIACGDRVCAVGGFDGTNRLRSAEEYTPATDSWSPLPEMNQPRSNFGIEVVDGVVYAVGGFNGFTTTFNSECYDRDEGRWFDVSDMSIYRSALSCCVVQGLPNVRDFVAPRDEVAAHNVAS
ncbi:kelch-like protein 10 [Petromyzon marinus]|uniref:Kelch-like protein 10 n=1 Tax=Petromyzon marinus TaxID=7757 RepID=A0AAJ7TYJ7_PETMA|nr:kelch-like protein 10 [Petromyzon marinus]